MTYSADLAQMREIEVEKKVLTKLDGRERGIGTVEVKRDDAVGVVEQQRWRPRRVRTTCTQRGEQHEAEGDLDQSSAACWSPIGIVLQPPTRSRAASTSD